MFLVSIKMKEEVCFLLSLVSSLYRKHGPALRERPLLELDRPAHQPVLQISSKPIESAPMPLTNLISVKTTNRYVVLTGGKTVRDIEWGWSMLWKIVRKFVQ